MSIWYCKVGTLHDIDLPDGADWPMREAIRQSFADLTGQDDEFCFSGWSAELTECELAVVENREPVRELVANESSEMLRAELTALRERLRDLIEGLERTHWSSWQTTAHFWKQFEAARTALESVNSPLEGK